MLVSVGIKSGGGGPHQSKTMMLAELTALLASSPADSPADAIVRDNLIGKPSIRAREAALYRLRQLYGVGEAWPICTILRRLWDRDREGRPTLALLCALARDPPLRLGPAPSSGESAANPVGTGPLVFVSLRDRALIGIMTTTARWSRFVAAKVL